MSFRSLALDSGTPCAICTSQILCDQRIQLLSDREIEVLKWTAEGKTSFEVAGILSIAERTVNFHITRVLAKLDAPNKTAAVARVARHRII